MTDAEFFDDFVQFGAEEFKSYRGRVEDQPRPEALAIAVLRRANSSHFNTSGKLFDLNQSLTRLGSREVMRIVTRSSVNSLLDGSGQSYGLRRGQLSRSAVGGAAVAHILAKKSGTVDPELAYTCGLLRDIGKLALDVYLGGKPVPQPTAGPDDTDTPTCYLQIERERFGADHAEIGEALAIRWGLPAPIPESIARHHEPKPPESEEHSALVDIVHAADIVVLWAGLAIGTDGLEYRVATHVRDTILRGRTKVEKLISDVWDEVSTFENELNSTASATEISA